MKEFMLLIHNEGDQKSGLSPISHQVFLRKCESYINQLKSEGKLVSAQPLRKEGVIITGSKTSFKVAPFTEGREMQVGYYHIMAEDLDEAIKIAKENPEFEYSTTAKIEVRPIKMVEVTTGFVYPKLV